MATYVVKANVGSETVSVVAEGQTAAGPITAVVNSGIARSDASRLLRRIVDRLRESRTMEPPAAYTAAGGATGNELEADFGAGLAIMQADFGAGLVSMEGTL